MKTPLTKDLSDCLENRAAASEFHIRFVNLNQRSLGGAVSRVDGKNIETDFLDRLVDRLYGGRTCRRNLGSLSDVVRPKNAARSSAPPGFLAPTTSQVSRFAIVARERLFEALQAVHLRGDTHITVRELRAALVYVLFGVHHCSDYHAFGDGSGMSIPQPYWDRAFSPGSTGRQGEVLRETSPFRSLP